MKVETSGDIKMEDPTISIAVAVLVGLVTVLLIFYLFNRRRRLGRGETGLLLVADRIPVSAGTNRIYVNIY